MRIDQLPVASTIGNTDTLPFSDGGITKQISVGNLTNSIRDDVYGAPLTASTSSAMTDTSRVYVYTGTTGGGFTNGHWYYYNGSAWTDGGIYNSVAVQTDPTLTLEGVPADAKATGELKTVIDDKLAEFDVAVETFYPHDGYNGPMVTVEGTVDAPPAELVIYGMSLQEGATPTPSAPVDIVTAGENGSIEMRSTNGSLFDPTFLLGASGWSVNGNAYSGDAYALWQQFNNTHWVPHVPSGTRLTISGRASIPSAVSYPRFVFNYTDGTTSNVNLTAVSEFVIFSGTSEVGKDVDYVTFTYSGNTSATMSLTNLRISIGTIDSGRDYIAPAVSAIPTPNGLPGIPVSSGGNYTDTDEQDWLCDTIDFKVGTWTKRCGIIDSYNGETLPGVWLSSKDVYVSGNSPTTGATVVYALAAPLVVQLSEEQLTALCALRGRKGQTVMYSTDPVVPEFRAEMYIDIPAYINEREPEIIDVAVETVMELLTDDVALSGITITPSPYNRFRPYFQPWIKEYTLSVVKGDTITITPNTDNSDLTVEFENIHTTTAQYYTMHIANGACELTFMGTGYDRGISILVSDGSRTVTYFVNLICAE